MKDNKSALAILVAIMAAAATSESRAMMAPWIYEQAIAEAAGHAVLGDLSVKLDAEKRQCEVEGTVLSALAGIGDFPRGLRRNPQRPRPDGPPSLPAIGSRMSATIPCFSPDTSSPLFGGEIYFRCRDLMTATEVMILLDNNGAYYPAYTAGFKIMRRNMVD